jgi:hypothetical protein
VGAAEDPDVVHGRRAPERLRGLVVELGLVGRPANPASVHRPLAAAAVPLPHRALHRGGDVARLGGPELPLRPGDEPLPPGALREQQVEPGAEDLLHRRAGVRVREGVARRVELHQELPRHGGVEPRELGRERLDAVALPVGSWGVHASCGRVGIDWFVRRTSGGRHRGPVRRRRGTELQGGGDGTRGGDPDRGHHIATRRILHRLQLGDELLRLLLGETEEPRKHLALVLGRQHVRELVHGGQAEAPITKRLDDGWEGTQRIAGRDFGSSAFRGRPSREKAPHAALRGRAARHLYDIVNERDCGGSFEDERATQSSRTHGLLASRSTPSRFPRAGPSRPPLLPCPSAPAAHPDRPARGTGRTMWPIMSP